MRLYCIYLFAWLTVCLLCTAGAYGQKLPFVNYNTANGLIHNRTHIIRQDGKGYIWIGTDLGINRYDGRTFRHYPCPGTSYEGARYAITNGGNVIFCIDYYGLAVCNGDSVRFIPLKADKPRSTNGCVYINDSSFYVVAYPRSIYKISGNTTQKVSLPDSLTKGTEFDDVFTDRKKNIWLLCNNGLIFFEQGDMARPLRLSFFDSAYSFCMKQDEDGNVYISSHKGIFRYAEAQCSHILSAIPEQLLPQLQVVTSMTFDGNGNLWMANCYKGLQKYNMQTKELSEYGIANGLVSMNAWGITRDQENNIWVATENGISKLTTQYYSSVDMLGSNYQNVKNICLWNDSTLLFSNLINIYAYCGGRVAQVKGYKSAVSYMSSIMLKTPDNKLLVNTVVSRDGAIFNPVSMLSSFSSNTLQGNSKLSSRPGGIDLVNMEYGTAATGDGLWLITSKGLQLYRNGNFSTPALPPVDGKSVAISYMAQSPTGDIWLINGGKELLCYSVSKATTGSFPYVLTLKQRLKPDPQENSYYTRVFADSAGHIFVCSSKKGVSIVYTDKNGTAIKIAHPAMSVFSSGIVNDITEDNYHKIWLATAFGLDRLSFYNDSFSVEKDLYGSELCGKYIFFIKQHGDKMFAGTTGCMGIINVRSQERAVPPEVYLSDIEINDVNNTALAGIRPTLPANENIITFSFTGISFKDERRIKYSYMLEGLEDQWSEPQAEYTVTYPRIPAGTYTFRVRGLSAAGIWSVKPASFTFTILQPFYLRWWFLLLAMAAVCTIIYIIYGYRINRLLEIQNIRQGISKDLHDDIGATVSSINILASMARSGLVTDSKRDQFLDTIKDESRHVSQSLSDIVWGIDPRHDSLEVMFARMQRYASELFEAKNIAYDFVLPQQALAGITISMANRQHMYLIFKEAVNNLVKYAGAANACITMSVNKGHFTIIIKDDGTGFDTNAAYTGNGLFNMKKRAQQLNARLTIESTPGTGTTISLQMHL